ncbi:hypothetical protein SB768_29755 [Burkholderia sp. SIMBA_043]|nr:MULTISPECIES: hypothetical protein [Burkholderia cepacia complex]AJY08120.1 putative lipoprotein [Burkholderia vietnamiensis LMG 10929]KVE66869.1 hypothetical protein WI96_10590 [Burkholderia vietnamiensis]KVS00166.1 hypothetical protein WK30_20210 [Burkholderia vietnamiensis]MBR8036282.1 hypothetical protein [Burkholderia vietnamiensis]UBI28868.1 hypothetical protein LA325_26965 [Burkholderia vietnamiensis]
MRWMKQGVAMGLAWAIAGVLAGCNTLDAEAPALPADAKVVLARVVRRVDFAQQGSGTTAEVGGGYLGGSGISSGGFLGAGLGFDLSRLFERGGSAPVYHYEVRLSDGTLRQLDTTSKVAPGRCVDVIDSAQPGYPRLRGSTDDCGP